MSRILLTCLAIHAAGPAVAGDMPDQFIDDRSSPESVITSLYNAIDRHEYLRGWSYFAPDGAPPYAEFRDGYAGTDSVRLRIGEVRSEGAAGSVYSTVPVALQATGTDGGVTVYTGCYRLMQVQPAIQDAPPFRPIQIDDGTLMLSDKPFATAMGSCAP